MPAAIVWIASSWMFIPLVLRHSKVEGAGWSCRKWIWRAWVVEGLTGLGFLAMVMVEASRGRDKLIRDLAAVFEFTCAWMICICDLLLTRMLHISIQ